MTDQPTSPIERALSERLDAEVEHWRRPLLFNRPHQVRRALARETERMAAEAADDDKGE